MASIYKLGRDKKKKHAPWYIGYRDHTGKRKVVKGFTDKSKTEQLAAKLENEAHLRRTGMIDTRLEEMVKRKQSEIEPYLKDFERSLSLGNNTAKHVGLTMGRVRRVIDGCKFKTLGDISVDAVESYLHDLRREVNLSHRTHNHYVQAFEQFGTWLMKKRLLAANPVVGLTRLDLQTNVRHRRRALTLKEFERLMHSARTSTETIQCYDGETRSRIYYLSFMTGLRRSEIASLTPASFCLNEGHPKVTIAATVSKHRKEDVLPLHPMLVKKLREWLSGLPCDAPLFPNLARRKTWLMVKKDLERAGILYETREGFADFHAAGRHSYITQLMRNGTKISVAKALARHTKIDMTMKYTHMDFEDQAKALDALPSPCQHIVSNSGDADVHEPALAVAVRQACEATSVDVSACELSPSHTNKQKRAPDGSGALEWRRRESNEEASNPNRLTRQSLATSGLPLSAHCQHSLVPGSHELTAADSALAAIIQAWSTLSSDSRSQVEALCLHPLPSDSSATQSPSNAELAEIVACWSNLSVAAKWAILTLARQSASQPGGEKK